MCSESLFTQEGNVLGFDMLNHRCILNCWTVCELPRYSYKAISEGASYGDQSTRCDFGQRWGTLANDEGGA